MNRIRTLLVDDDPQFLKTAAWFLSAEQRYSLIAGVLTIADMQTVLMQQQLDLILIDMQLVLNNGSQVGAMIKTLTFVPKMILMSVFDTEYCRQHAHLYGAEDCVSKVRFADEIRLLTGTFFPN